MTSVSAASEIVAQDMGKSFGDHLVLDKVSLAVEEGNGVVTFIAAGAVVRPTVRIAHIDAADYAR